MPRVGTVGKCGPDAGGAVFYTTCVWPGFTCTLPWVASFAPGRGVRSPSGSRKKKIAAISTTTSTATAQGVQLGQRDFGGSIVVTARRWLEMVFVEGCGCIPD